MPHHVQTTGMCGRKYYTEKLSNTQRFEVDVRYQNLKMIGAGAYGLVCKAKDTIRGDEVAIKKVRDVFTDLVDAKRILRELKLLMHLGKHPNIVHIRDIMINPPNSKDFKDLYIVTNKFDCDLYRILNSGQNLTDDHFSWFLYQLLCGLKYVHSAAVMHRDLKPSNLLVNANCDLALCDFGLARGEPGPGVAMTEYVVTRWYRAPELLCENTTYDNEVDMWSVGLIFAEILTKQPLLQGKDYMDQLSRIIKLVGAVSEEDMKCIQVEGAQDMVKHLSQKYKEPQDFAKFFAPYTKDPDAIDLLKKMLVFNPKKRITVDEALKHKYLAAHYDQASLQTCKKKFDADFEAGYPEEMPKGLIQQYMLGMMKEMVESNKADTSNGASSAGASKADDGAAPTDYELELLEEKDTKWQKDELIADAILAQHPVKPKYRPWMRPPTVLTFKRTNKGSKVRYKVLFKARSYAKGVKSHNDLKSEHETRKIFGAAYYDEATRKIDVICSSEPDDRQVQEMKVHKKFPSVTGNDKNCVIS